MDIVSTHEVSKEVFTVIIKFLSLILEDVL